MQLRTKYIDKIKSLSGKGIIAILTGMRRIGKSTIMKQYIDIVGIDKCIYIQLESLEWINKLDIEHIYNYIKTNISNKKYILIDEIQIISDREKLVNGLLAEFGQKIDIIITGSNSNLLSTEISTQLRGRTFNIYVYPFGFAEFCEYHRYSLTGESFVKYISIGGMPSIYNLELNQQGPWIEGLINTVFIKDIVERYNIKDIDMVKNIFWYILNTISDQTNIANIKNYLNQKGNNISINTAGNYVQYLINSLLVNASEMYDIQGKKILDRLKKYYSGDHAMRKYVFSDYDIGIGKILENYVYISLLRAGYDVHIGRIGNLEVDFIATKNNNKIYIQVAYILATPQVIDREFGSLSKIKDNRSKYVVSMDPINHGNNQGIQHILAHERESELERI